jgi:type VI secretion system protein ImpK
MTDNPFDEAEDNDRTVLRGPARPVAQVGPQGGAAAPVPPQSSPVFSAPPLAGGAESVPHVGTGPLAATAAPLLEIVARIATAGMNAAPDPAGLHERTIHALRRFEADAQAAGASADEMREAHYILCAALDDVVLATPWGARSGWSVRSLGSTFHNDVRSGEHVFDRLAAMQREPGRFRGALEIAYMALSLGLQGRYRLAPQGPAELDRIRSGLYQLLINLRGAAEKELSPHWRGMDAPHRRPGHSVPAWVAAPVALALVTGVWFWAFHDTGTRAEELEARLAALPPGALPTIDRSAPPVPPAPPPPPPPQAQRADASGSLRRFLAPEIARRIVTVESDAQRLMVRISNPGMFASGSATLNPEFEPLMRRIGEALKEEPGAVQVLGHSDNQPIRTVRFRSNAALSQARAEAALTVIQRANGDPSRFMAEGRADSEPIASNATAEGREANRRIEIVLRRGAAQ